MDGFRERCKAIVGEAVEIKKIIQRDGDADDQQNSPEMIANLVLAIRHIEDAAMRFGKVIQAASGGESPLGGPNTPR